MAMIDRNFTFATNGTVSAADLHNLIDSATIYQDLITGQVPITSVGTNYELLIADGTNPNAAPNAVTVYDLFDDALTAGTYTGLNLTGALTYGTATGNRTVSTSATITTGTITNLTSSTANITLGTIPTLTAGTTTSTAATITSGTITNLASTTGTIATLNSTTGTIATLNSTTGTIATLNSTTGTIATLNSTTPTFLGAITASTNTINVGSGQIFKDASGNVGVGTTSPINNPGYGGITLNGTSGALLSMTTNGTESSRIASIGDDTSIQSKATTGIITFVQGVIGGTERLRIDSDGNVLVGGTNTEPAGNSTSGVAIKPPATSANGMVEICNANTTALVLGSTTGDATLARFRRAGIGVGTISVTAGATAYATSSDYRLKTNLEPISNAIERIKQLPVYRFNWIADQSGNKVDGFIAHEAQPIVPEAIVGARDEIDAEGNPIYQGIDQSKIVPLLTAALKEAIAKIETLEAKVTALEAA